MDTGLLLQELLLCEKWARHNKLPFPKIDTTIVEKEGFNPNAYQKKTVPSIFYNINNRELSSFALWNIL